MQLDQGLIGYEGAFGYVPGYFERDNEVVQAGQLSSST